MAYIRFVIPHVDKQSRRVIVQTIVTEKPGYVVYEDAHQVAAEPFEETGA